MTAERGAVQRRWPRRLGWPRSLRLRLTLQATAVVAVVLAGIGLVIAAVVESSLTSSLDSANTAQVNALGSLADRGRLPDRPPPAGEGVYVQVIAEDGTVRYASPGLERAAPILRLRPGNDQRVATLRDTGFGGDAAIRVLARRVRTPTGSWTVVAATSLRVVTGSAEALARVLLIGYPLLLAAVALAAWSLVGRSLAPVEAMRAEAADIAAHAPAKRLTLPDRATELNRLGRTLNAMLDRLQAANGRQRQFVGDASHELRSPLAALRTKAETALAHPGRTTVSALAERVLTDEGRMETLVTDLLSLARLDEGASAGQQQPVDLAGIASAVADTTEASLVAVNVRSGGAFVVMVDPDQMIRVLRNLVDNATRHATSAVTITIERRGDEVELRVIDDGPGIPPDQRERIFERFTRLDLGRGRGEGGPGLGLSIARELARANGATLEALARETGAEMLLRLPVCTNGSITLG